MNLDRTISVMKIEEKNENFEYTKAVFRSSNSKDRRYMTSMGL